MPEAQTLLDNRYSILHIERTSNFSKVFFALDTYQNPPRSCVIKILQPFVQKPEVAQWIQEEFQKEANHLKQLSLCNPYLPQIYTYSKDSLGYYLVRELIEGTTLKEKVETKGKLFAIEVKQILVKLLKVLNYLHKRKVIHQNIKPKNIILRDNDHLPMLINFGSIRQIVTTFDFCRDKRIFSCNNVYGYIPSEQALGQPVPASDLYSLGLTAVYLLTAKNPKDLHIDLNHGNFKMPLEISHTDPELAAILARAISLNSSDRYSSAQEMLDALLRIKSQPYLDKHKPENSYLNLDTPSSKSKGLFISTSKAVAADRQSKYDRRSQQRSNSALVEGDAESRLFYGAVIYDFNWWKIIIYILSSFYFLGAGIIALYDWNSSQNTFIPQLPEPSTPFPSTLPHSIKAVSKKPYMLNIQSKDLVEVPIFATGTQKKQLRKVLGEPNAIQKGYWVNSSAWIYKGRGNGLIDIGYLFDLNTNKLRQTEMAIAPSVGLGTTTEILGSLLQGNITPSVNQGLKKIYQRQANEYSFRLGDLSGSIERDKNDNIYLGVWQSDFH
ncbi:serine/threonine-protein kinase [Pleurocapsa sp. FMAR1]|uniref:serine/threonine-protein kinase n=1 Tax=Pleurocapsa sp. FMAR1 TaxID=3040204 RepID=UPI0029C88E26|nr:serine/threonine-protein kinase [Pleurocapsa sp. FMAR1]